MTDLESAQLVAMVRYFNLAMNIGTVALLLFQFKSNSAYRKMNIIFGVALFYGICIYTEALIHGHSILPIFSALGSTLNTLAIITATFSQLGGGKNDNN